MVLLRFYIIRIASHDAKFGLPEIGLGTIPADGGTQTLSRTVGRSHALDILINGRWIDANEAYRIKLADKTTEREKLMDQVMALANRIAAYDPYAIRSVKKLLGTVWACRYQQVLNSKINSVC